MKGVYLVLGWCAVGLAIAGAMLPGLPCTVFVLAASYCFSRSSPRFERWLREHRWLGPPLQRFSAGGGLPASAKRAAVAAMWIAILVSSTALAAVHWAAAAALIGLGVVGTVSIVFGVRTTPEPDSSASLKT
jgi:uncharacterized protein